MSFVHARMLRSGSPVWAQSCASSAEADVQPAMRMRRETNPVRTNNFMAHPNASRGRIEGPVRHARPNETGLCPGRFIPCDRTHCRPSAPPNQALVRLVDAWFRSPRPAPRRRWATPGPRSSCFSPQTGDARSEMPDYRFPRSWSVGTPRTTARAGPANARTGGPNFFFQALVQLVMPT
jgi:hypothetical protein